MSHEVRTGDFIIISSDGLFDNLYEDEIALVINSHLYGEQKSLINDNPLAAVVAAASEQSETVSENKVGEDKEEESVVTNDKLSEACELLVRRASKGERNHIYNLA
jgi:serine/threonine protein phosphatase PrpC